MEDRKPTPQESMEIISRMIDESKQRIAMPDVRISVMWAVLSVLTAAVVLTLYLTTGNIWYNFLWFAIPLIGFPLSHAMARMTRVESGVRTYVDRISEVMWRIVGGIAIFLTGICIIFQAVGYPQAWIAMFYYAFVVVGFGAAMQGVILRENSYVFGGIFSIIAGLTLTVCPICGFGLPMIWTIPLYMLCFILMFIVPAIVMRRKFAKEGK